MQPFLAIHLGLKMKFYLGLPGIFTLAHRSGLAAIPSSPNGTLFTNETNDEIINHIIADEIPEGNTIEATTKNPSIDGEPIETHSAGISIQMSNDESLEKPTIEMSDDESLNTPEEISTTTSTQTPISLDGELEPVKLWLPPSSSSSQQLTDVSFQRSDSISTTEIITTSEPSEPTVTRRVKFAGESSEMTPSEIPTDFDTTPKSILKSSISHEEDADQPGADIPADSLEDTIDNGLSPITATHTSPVHKATDFEVEAAAIDEDGSTFIPPVLDISENNKTTTPPMTTLPKRSTQYIPQKVGKKAPVQESAVGAAPNSSPAMRAGTAILIIIACIANSI